MLKKILLTIGLLGLCCTDASAGVFGGLLSRDDTLSVPFAFLDSAGNMVNADVTQDSIYIGVFSPGGDSIYAEKLRMDDARIDLIVATGTAFLRSYSFNEVISTLDGSSTSIGTYSYMLQTDDNSIGPLKTYWRGTFQVIHATVEFNDRFDSIGVAAVAAVATLDSIQLYDTRWDSALAALSDGSIGDKVWVDAATRTLSALGFNLDSTDFEDSTLIGAIFATNYYAEFASKEELAAVTADSTLGHVDTGWAADTPGDKIKSILDTLENQDNWVATQANQTLIIDTVNGIIDTLQLQDGWVAHQTTSDSIYDSLALHEAGAATVANQTLIIDTVNDIINVVDGLHDTLIYHGPFGLGVYIDSTVGNTNTVVGVDGTAKNPVSTFVAARTIADNLGYNRYYIVGRSTFNGATTDLSASHLDWDFIGIGQMGELAFGGQNVNGSRFQNLGLSGAMHSAQSDHIFEDCIFGFISTNYTGHAFRCFFTDTIVLKNAANIEFNQCVSGVAGNNTPTIDFSLGTSSANIRHYSGGLRIMNGASNDTVSIETDGQVIISANNTSLNITLRGMLTPDDSGTTTNLTKDAVFSRSESHLWVPGPVWNQLADSGFAAGTMGDSAKGWGATAASALDSTILSNVLHRVVWGTPVGSGSDSSTLAERDATIAAFIAGVFDSTAFDDSTFASKLFATNFYNEFATKEELASEVADSNWLSLFEARDGVAGSFGDSAQGWSGSGATVTLAAGQFSKIRDSVWQSIFATAVAGSYSDSLEQILRWADTANFAPIADVWRNQDTVNVDSSDIGVWLVNNLAGGAGSDTTAIKAMMRNNGPLFAYISPLNTVRNPGFEDDSVTTTTPPAGWVQGIGDEAGSGIRIAEAGGGRYQYASASSLNETSILYQHIGELPAGHYWLGGTIFGQNNSDAYILIDNEVPTTTSSHIDSVSPAAIDTLLEIGKVVEIAAFTDIYIGLRMDELLGADTFRFDNIKLIPLTLDTTSYQGAGGGSDTTSILTMLINNYDSLMHNVNDSVWLELLAALDGVAGSFGDSAQGWGATSSLAGSGAILFIVGATDTSGTDTLVSGVPITLRDILGNQIGVVQTTNSNGHTSWNGTQDDSLTVQILGTIHNAHIWPATLDTIVVPSAVDTFDVAHGDSILMGYDISITLPPSDSQTTVYGDIWTAASVGVKGVTITASLRGLTAIDTLNGVVIGPDIISTTTDSLGHWELPPLLRSSHLKPVQPYIFTAFKQVRVGQSRLKQTNYYFPTDPALVLPVPDSATWKLTW